MQAARRHSYRKPLEIDDGPRPVPIRRELERKILGIARGVGASAVVDFVGADRMLGLALATTRQ